MANSRFNPQLGERTLRFTERDLQILKLWDNYRILPFNWLHALIGGKYDALRNRCTLLVAGGYLGRFTFNGSKNIYETMTYYLTEKGRKALLGMGHPSPDPYDKTHDAHQVLLDIYDAAIELGAKDKVELLKWEYVKNHPKADIPESPFKFKVDDTTLIPDGRPFVLRTNNGAALFLKELDRNTEAPSTIKAKIKNYHRAEQFIKHRYGCNRLFLIWITTNETRAQHIKAWIGNSNWMKVTTIFDHTPLGMPHAVSTRHFDELLKIMEA